MPMLTNRVPGLVLFVALCLALSAARAQTTVAGFTPSSFRVTETGAATYTIPIQVPPGIAGMQPSLALAYSSQSGSGMLGSGLGLSGLSAVHRCGRTIVQDGISGGVHFDANDRFCLDGQRLVAVSGAYGANGTEYRTERESFARIVSYGAAGSGPAWFKAWTKSGQVLEFGSTDDSRIEAQGKASAWVWGLNKATDTAGNFLTITYEEDNANGDSRPLLIQYTGHASPPVAPFAKVEFSYETRTDTPAFYVAGSKLSVQKRLTNIKTYVQTNLVRDYRIVYEYAPDGGSSRAVSVTECAGGFCFSPVTFSWLNPVGVLGFGAAAWAAGNAAALGDVNGDGRADLVTASCTEATEAMPSICTVGLALNNGGGFGAVTEIWSGSGMGRLSLGDVNGDGKADLVIGSTLRFSTGAGFGSPVSIAGNGLLGDINGDGLADLVALSCTVANEASPSICDVSVALSNGGGFGSLAYQFNFSTSTGRASLGDVNGDGWMDLSGGGNVWFSNGSGFSTPATWVGGDGVLADVNGDGLADMVRATCIYNEAEQSCGLDFWVSDGSQLALTTAAGPSCAGCVASTIAFGDIDGDGRADVTLGGYVRFANVVTLSLLSSATNSLGSSVAFTYKPLTDATVYAKDSDAVWPVRDLREQGPLRVVSAMTESNGLAGTQTTDYFYRGAKAHLRGGGMLGFRQIESAPQGTGKKSLATFRQGYPFKGLPSITEVQQASGTTISRVTNTWTDNPAINALGYGFGSGNYHRSDLTQSVTQSYELNGNLVTTVTTTSAYDAYGNATSISVGTGDGYSKLTTNTYAAADTGNWILGRLARSAVQSTIPAGSQTRTSAFEYDAATGLLTKETVEPDNPNFCLATAYGYDEYGNKVSSTTANCSGATGDALFAARSSTTSFAATAANPVPGQLPSSSTNALGHSEAKEFDPNTGAVTKLTGPNGLATTWGYDAFGRKISESRADGTTTTWTFTNCGTCPTYGRYFVTETSTGTPTRIVHYDNLNREIRTDVEGFDGVSVRKKTEYDSLGRVARVSKPFKNLDSQYWTVYAYDILGRVTQVDEPATASGAVRTVTTYNGLVTTVTVSNAGSGGNMPGGVTQSRTTTKNSQGQVILVTTQ